MKVLIVIPARGGSKGIPRKNLRPLAGKPLLHYSISNAKKIHGDVTIVISSEDEEILSFAAEYGVETHQRKLDLAQDMTTLDEVIVDLYDSYRQRKFDYIVTLQPTSPTLSAESINLGLRKIAAEKLDSIISVKEIRHLFWITNEEGKVVPFHPKRVNRQQLKPVYFETGGVVITTAHQLEHNRKRLSDKPGQLVLPENEAIDIDSDGDWAIAEHVLTLKRVAFIVIGNAVNGMGHTYNCLELASEMVTSDLYFFIREDQVLAINKISDNNYRVKTYKNNDELASLLTTFKPDIIVNDTLNTDREYARSLKALTKRLVLIEDLGEGRAEADLVVNAMYSDENMANECSGPKYYCLRSDLSRSVANEFRDIPKKVVIFFGGVDPSGVSLRVLTAIYSGCVKSDIAIQVVLGAGNQLSEDELKHFNVEVLRDVKDMSKVLKGADIAFTSAGRSAFEVYSMRVPTIVICQNVKETTHPFASGHNGFINLGLASKVSEGDIERAFISLLDKDLRFSLYQCMNTINMRQGRHRVVQKILECP